MYTAGAIIAGLIGLGCLIGAIVAFVRQRRQRGEAITTTGVVTGLQKRVMNPGSSGVYCPTVEFTALSGERVSFESAYGSMPAAHQVGQAVKVYYDPSKPARAEVDSGLTRWLAPGCLLAFALGSCFFSVLFLVLSMVLSQS
jgi:hypothetical protein